MTRWAGCSVQRELVEVCHGQGAETEALRNEAEVGAALCFLGKETEGMARIDSVIALLDVKKFNELDAMLIVLKRKVMVLAERALCRDVAAGLPDAGATQRLRAALRPLSRQQLP